MFYFSQQNGPKKSFLKVQSIFEFNAELLWQLCRLSFFKIAGYFGLIRALLFTDFTQVDLLTIRWCQRKLKIYSEKKVVTTRTASVIIKK